MQTREREGHCDAVASGQGHDIAAKVYLVISSVICMWFADLDQRQSYVVLELVDEPALGTGLAAGIIDNVAGYDMSPRDAVLVGEQPVEMRGRHPGGPTSLSSALEGCGREAISRIYARRRGRDVRKVTKQYGIRS